MSKLVRLLIVFLLFTLGAWATSTNFDGVDSKVQVTHSSDIGGSTFSMGGWTYRAGDGEGGFGRVYDKLASGNGHILFVISGTKMRMSVGFSGTQGRWDFDKPTANEWHHVMCTWSGTDATTDPVCYVDGVSVSITEAQTPVGTANMGTAALVFGNNTGQTLTWSGCLASMAYYDRVLSASEVNQVMRMGPQTLRNGLVGYWPLGVFGGRNYTSTSGLDGTETATSISCPKGGPPVSVPQGGMPGL